MGLVIRLSRISKLGYVGNIEDKTERNLDMTKGIGF